MILADTSVWIDLLGGKKSAEATALEHAIITGQDICLCPVITMEILQGVRDDRVHAKLKARLAVFIELPIHQSTYAMATDIYRAARKKGLTIRKPIDCIIAATAIEHDAELLHADRDFDAVAKVSPLRLFES